MSPRENSSQITSHESFNSIESALKRNDELEYSTDDDVVDPSPRFEDVASTDASARKRVVFGNIQVREYNRTIGDNPSVRVGIPVALDWHFSELPVLSIDEYEGSRPPYKTMLRLSSITRRNMLLNVWGYSEEDIASADKEVQKIKRRQSQGSASGAVENTTRKANSVGRKLRKGFMKSLVATSRMMAPQLMTQAY